MMDSELRAKIAAGDSAAWDALRAWLSSAAAERIKPADFAEIERAIDRWPAAVRAAGPDDWARIEGGGEPPAWWPLVRTVTIDGWTSLDPIDALHGIESVHFQQRAQTSSLARLAQLPVLRQVVVGGLGSEGLTALPPLPGLEHLSATADRLPPGFAARFPSLRSLSLANSSQLETLPALPDRLVELDLSGCVRLVDIEAVAACETLQGIDLRRCDGVRDLSPLAGLPALERVRLDAGTERRLDPVAARTTLRDLWIGRGDATVDVRPLQHHQRLQALALERCTTVQGLKDLELPALEELHIIRCGVTGLPDLRVSERLRVLDLEGLSIHALPRIASGRVLEYLRLVDMSALGPDVHRPAAHHVVEKPSLP
jgi:hypothetical protein